MTTSSRGNGPRIESAARQLARDVASLQATLLARLHEELAGGDTAAFSAAGRQLAEELGSVTATAIGALWEPHSSRAPDQEAPGAPHWPGEMRRRLDQLIETNRRYGHPFALVAIDVDGPGARGEGPGGGQEAALAIVGAALRDSVRLVDETFPFEESGLCVLAPNQTTVGGVQMAERLLRMLDDLEDAGGLRIGISAGVVACPEHGVNADELLRKADEAMWRARAVGQPLGIGLLQDR